MRVQHRDLLRSLQQSIRLLPALVLVIAGSAMAYAAAAADPGGAAAPAAAQTGCLDEPLLEMGNSGVAGTAQLCLSDAGVRAQVDTRNLAPGDAYTAWFVYFDQPTTCMGASCAPPDVVGDDPPGVLGRMDSLVADGMGVGDFSGRFRGLRVSSGAEVHLPIFGHGLADTDDNRARARQLLTPEEPVLGAPGLGVPAANHHGAAVAVARFQIP
jgi:hypothetical protein